MKIKELLEASYPGNIGMMEMFQFYGAASKEQKLKMKELLDSKQFKKAWDFLQQVVNVTLN